MAQDFPRRPLNDTYVEYAAETMVQRATDLRMLAERRRSVRQFSDRPMARTVIEQCLLTAGTAPSGAHLQPWHFVVVSNPSLKQQIRSAAEAEERAFYHERATPEWLAALAPLGTDEHKPYLELAPYLIAIFVQRYGLDRAGNQLKHYYATESVGIATGMLIMALHNAGLATLTHTPSPMGFLNTLLERPTSERAFLLLVAGYPHIDAQVPDLQRKSLDDIAEFR